VVPPIAVSPSQASQLNVSSDVNNGLPLRGINGWMNSTVNTMVPVHVQLLTVDSQVVSLDGTFAYRTPPLVMSVLPLTLPQSGGMLTVRIVGTLSLHSLYCRFTESGVVTVVPITSAPVQTALPLDASYGVCSHAAFANTGSFAMEVFASTNVSLSATMVDSSVAVQWKSQLIVLPTPQVVSITAPPSPAKCGSTDPLLLFVNGVGFSNTDHLMCRFRINETMGIVAYDYRTDVPAMFESTTRVRCTIERSVCGLLGAPISIEISINGQDYTTNGASFTFPQRVLIDTDVKVLPIGTNIGFIVRGLGLATGPAVSCRLRVGSLSAIGSLTILPATNKNPTNASCVINTQLPAARAAILDLLLADGSLWSTDQATIALQPPTLVISVAPLFLYTSSGLNWVNVTGVGFTRNQTINCVIDGQLTSIVFVNSTLVQCPVTASVNESSISIEVTNVLPYAFTNSGVQIKIRNVPTLTGVVPALFSHVGDVQLTLSGTGFMSAMDSGAQPMCVFTSSKGDFKGSSNAPLSMISVSSTIMSDTVVVCQLGTQPALPLMTPIYVSFTANGVNFANNNVTLSSGAPSFQLYGEPTLFDTTYARAIPSTGLVNLTILGTNFITNDNITAISPSTSPRCFWEPYAVWTPAHIINSTYAYCIVAPVVANRSVTVSISLDGLCRGTSSLSLLVYDAPRLVHLWPNMGAVEGTLIDLYGSGFPINASTCVFNRSVYVWPLAMNSTWMRCMAPYWPQVETVPVAVSFYSNQTMTFEARSFTYWTATVSSLSPTYANTSGGTEVHLYGTGFVDRPTLTCRFRSMNVSRTADVISSGNMSSYAASSDDFQARSLITTPGVLFAYSSAWFVSTTEVACISPVFAPSDNVLVDLSLNGIDYVPQAQVFAFVPSTSIQVFSYFPVLGRSSGNIPINISGYGFGFGTVGCMFDDTLIPATIYSPNQIMCVGPRRPDKYTSTIRVTSYLNNRIWQQSEPFKFLSVAEPSSTTVVPLLGKLEGGYTITLIGTNFVNLTTVKCAFRPMVANAMSVLTRFVFLNSSAGTCDTPSAESVVGYTPTDATQVTISLLYNGLHTAPSIVLYTYVVGSPHVFNSVPLIGGGAGDFDVIINGTNFVRTLTLACRFRSPKMAEILVNARYVSPTSMVCNAPATPAGLVKIDVTVDGINYSDEFTSFTSIDMALTNILKIVPTHGPMTGGTLITASLLIHSNATQLFRLSNSLVVSRSFIATPVPGLLRTMTAVIPSTTATPGLPMLIQVSLDDGVTWSTTPVAFTYDPQIFAYSVHPWRVYSNWTRPLTIIGNNFQQSAAQTGELLCRFNRSEVVRASYINSSAIVCQQPYFGTFVGTIPVDISQNNYQYVSGVTLTLVPRPQLFSVTPTRFQSDQSNTDMWLTGSGFDPTVRLICRFMSDNVDKTTVQAQYYNSTKARCPIPPMWNTIGNSSVVISIDDGAFFSTSFPIISEPSVSITSVYPASGLATQPMLIWLTGRFLVHDEPLLCSVGTQGLKSQPIFAVAQTVACLVPPAIDLFFPGNQLIDPRNDNTELDIDVPVAIVSLNGKEISSPASFRYVGQCPIGSYCPDNMLVLPCPTGSFFICSVIVLISFFHFSILLFCFLRCVLPDHGSQQILVVSAGYVPASRCFAGLSDLRTRRLLSGLWYADARYVPAGLGVRHYLADVSQRCLRCWSVLCSRLG
jgi:hypothetical protein